MSWYTPEVARDIARIVREHHAAVAVVLFGKDATSAEDWDLAVRLGLVDPSAPPPSRMGALHTYGAVLAHLHQAQERQDAYGWSWDRVVEHVERNPLPRTDWERRAAEFSARRGAEYVVSLGHRAAGQLSSRLVELDHQSDQELRGVVRDVVSARFGDPAAQKRMEAAGAAKGLDRDFFRHTLRKTVRQVASDLGHLTEEWSVDLQRIAHTETHRAVEEGIKESWLAQEEDKPPEKRRPVLVYKLPRPGACAHCLRLHLDGEHPRVYDLAELQGNGTNQGRRAADWRATVGPVHPWCGCSLHRVPSLAATLVPDTWHSGEAIPSLVGPGGRLQLPRVR